MSKLLAFNIEFSNPNGVYFAGQQLSGKLILALKEPMKMRNVRLEFVGLAYTHWREHRDNTTHYYSAQENYFAAQMVMWGLQPGDNRDAPIMSPGHFEFPFCYQLPPNCPTSFEGGYGHIRYTVTATIDKPWKFNHTTKCAFTVLGIQDLNRDPYASMPISNHKGKELGLLLWKSGKISAHISLPKRGFVPGELLPIQLTVNNESTRRLHHVLLELKQNIVYKAQHNSLMGSMWHVRHEVRTVLSTLKDLENCPPGQPYVWPNEAIVIPPVPPMLLNCSIIDINYTLHVEVKPHGMSFDLDLYTPITIGTIPLNSAFQPAMAAPNFRPPGQQPAAGYALPSAPAPEYSNLPPPSYEESVFGKSNVRDKNDTQYTQGPAEFAPRYPSYHEWSK